MQCNCISACGYTCIRIITGYGGFQIRIELRCREALRCPRGLRLKPLWIGIRAAQHPLHSCSCSRFLQAWHPSPGSAYTGLDSGSCSGERQRQESTFSRALVFPQQNVRHVPRAHVLTGSCAKCISSSNAGQTLPHPSPYRHHFRLKLKMKKHKYLRDRENECVSELTGLIKSVPLPRVLTRMYANSQCICTQTEFPCDVSLRAGSNFYND